MNLRIPLYQLVHSGASIYLARLETVDIIPGEPGQERVALAFTIAETLFGEQGGPIRRAEFSRPVSQTAQLKYPDPIWGRVKLEAGVLVFLATAARDETPTDPLYADQVQEPADPVLNAIREVLDYERVVFELRRKGQDGQARRTLYLNYLGSGVIVKELFGAEALAKDGDLPAIDSTGQVAQAMVAVFTSEQNVFVRLSVGALMWESIYPRTNPAGQVAILNATLRGVSDDSEDIRRFSLDQLFVVDPTDVKQSGVMSSPEAVRLLRKQLAQETDPEVRDHLQRLIDALPT